MKDEQAVVLVKNDPESISLLHKLETSSAPLTIEDLPNEDSIINNGDLHRLFELNKLGWITTGWIVVGDEDKPDGYLRTFNISDKGRELMKLV